MRITHFHLESTLRIVELKIYSICIPVWRGQRIYLLICLLIYGLVNYAVGSLTYTPPNHRIISTIRTENDVHRGCRDTISDTIPALHWGIEENHESPGRDLNSQPLEQEARMLTHCTTTFRAVSMSKLNHTKTAQKTGTASEGSVPADIRQRGSSGRVSWRTQS